jgi:predicted transcriptional regulator
MPKDAVFTMKIEPELRDAFMAEAAASHRPASQIVREAMRDFIDQQKKQRDYDAWFIAEMEEGLREADDPNTVWIPHEEVKADMERQRQSLLARMKASGE